MPVIKNGQKLNATKEVISAIQRQTIIINEATAAAEELLYRRGALAGGNNPDKRRSLWNDCGYPDTISLKQYKDMFDREGIAARAVAIYPDECWSVEPEIYETEEEQDTPLEAGWKTLCQHPDNNPVSYMHRIDVMSGIGHYGALLIGLDDKRDLSLPAQGVDEAGAPSLRTRDHKLIYLRAFDEQSARIASYQGDSNNPRFGKPLFYDLDFADMSLASANTNASDGLKVMTKRVHWSRIIHVADNRQGSETIGTPRLKNLFNKIEDLQKNLGGSAEMFYKGGFPGLSVELDPRVLETLNVTINQDSVHAEMYKYMNSLQRYISVVGMNVKSLAPQIVSPEGHIRVQMESIACAANVPLRIFMGSEQAQLASGQDVRTWNRRLRRRHLRYLSPYVVRPLVDRFIMFGILPAAQSDKGYQINWPDVNLPTEDEQSQIADRRAASLMKYAMSGAWQFIQPSDFFRFVIGLTPEQVAVIMRKIKLPAEVKYDALLTTGGPADSGTKGNAPSKPTKGGVVT